MVIYECKNRGMTDQLFQTDRVALLVVEDQVEGDLLAQPLIESNPLPGRLLVLGFFDMGVNGRL